MNVKSYAAADDTRRRIIESAGEVFAERGFHSATVREITDKAGANIAAIHYHFRDKVELYAAALRLAHSAAAPISSQTGTPKQKLRGFIFSFLRHLLDPSRPRWHGRLMAREMTEPTAALDQVVSESIRPRCESLRLIIEELCARKLTRDEIALATCSIVGQCLFYLHARPVVERLFPDLRCGPGEIDRLAQHITEFSLPGVRRLGQPRLTAPAASGKRKTLKKKSRS